MLTNIKKIHFIGIGGAGMSALARILTEKGYEVSGSDIKSSKVTESLEALGARIYIGQRAENLHEVEAIVVSTAIKADNPEYLAAKEKGLLCLHRSDINAFLINNTKGIAVAGSHGKTTTTSMLGVVLDKAGLSPSIIIGGEVDYLGTNARLGKGEYLVSEADESDGTFLKYYPYIGIITNIENDHLDHYGSMDNIIKAFKQFLAQIRPEGFCVACGENAIIKELIQDSDRRCITYAITEEADYKAVNIHQEVGETTFSVQHEGKILGDIRLLVPGRHNILNALATIAVGVELGLSLEAISQGMDLFHGAKRRFQTKGREKGIWVVDDYAHHPTEIDTTLGAALQTKPGRLVCVFQPHRYSRTKLLQREYGSCFKKADLLILTDIYPAGEAPIAGIDGELLVREVKAQTGQEVIYIQNKGEIASYLYNNCQEGDLIITMGAGDIVKSGEELVELLSKK